MAMLAIRSPRAYSDIDMKHLSTLLAILFLTTLIARFDAVVIFLLSGFIPGLNVTLPPSTMLAVMVASGILLLALKKWPQVYGRCLTLYDQIVTGQKIIHSA